jgi:hypothetical protein
MDDDRGARTILALGHALLVTGPSPSLLLIHEYSSCDGVNRRKRQRPPNWFVSQLAVGPGSIH